ncbi:MAG TPA: alpha/beta hydrolase [Fastidiosipila sp.]|nr:alpha/beta hydrolase [Fastidiosipila sp.]
MDIKRTFSELNTLTGQPLEARLYGPAVGEMKQIVIVIHGMAEYSDRYLELAQRLTAEGIGVLLFDLPGHGKRARESLTLGHFADRNGDTFVLADIHALIREVMAAYPEQTFVLFGHSMGSMIARCLMSEDMHGFTACVFTGTIGKNATLSPGRFLARVISAIKGPRHRSPLMNRLMLMNYGKLAKDNAWLSRDVTLVDRYNADPLCGFSFTARALGDLLTWATKINKAKTLDRISRKARYLFISGDQDPIGNNGKGIRWLARELKKRQRSVEVVLLEDSRHEVFNELNKDDAYEALLTFLGCKPKEIINRDDAFQEEANDHH